MEEFDRWATEEPLHNIEGFENFVTEGDFDLDEEDLLLYSLLIDPIYAAELLWDNPTNHEYGGLYRVHDFQYPLWRTVSLYAGYACARAVGKTESIKGAAFSHTFKRLGEDMLVTAPELIHLQPVTDAIEDRIRDTRLTREFLDTRGGQSGFTHKPFGVNFLDGTKIVGRIPRLTGPQPIDSRLLTPRGWVTMGDVEPGDLVIGPSGQPTEVLGATNTWEADVFRVEFTDGSIVRADAKHRWRVRTDSGDWSIQCTEDLERGIRGPVKGYGGKLNMWRVPQQAAVEYEPFNEPPPLDPYLVGALLGDGAISARHAQLICADEELVEYVRDGLPPGCSLTQTDPIRFLFVGPDRHKPNPVLQGLRELGLLGHTAHTKFIPERYKRGSYSERLELVRGLLDTDGTAKAVGSSHLILASKQLVEDCAEVVRSLGGWASTGSEVVGEKNTYYRATFRMENVNLFRLRRKADKVKLGRMRHRSIRAVVPDGRSLVRCIKVAAGDEAYLTDNLIATLNTGVKGMHEPDLRMEEAQDYPEKGWTEVHETVEKDHVDAAGESDFTYWFYGVHSGNRESGFYKRLKPTGKGKTAFTLVSITRLQTLKWNKAEKDAAIAAYGGVNAPDYRRNILGEAGAATSPFFVMSRLMASMDQDSESDYNENHFVFQRIHAEDIEELEAEMKDILNLPLTHGHIHGGMDLGLTESPSVISLFSAEKIKNVPRLKLLRVYELWRLRPRQLRAALYALAFHFGPKLKSFGMDVTGLGFPIWQDMEDDETAPQHLLDVSRGYFFNAAVPVGVQKEFIIEDNKGGMRDQFGSAVKEEVDPLSGERRYVTTMPMIEASTRYVRDWIDSGRLLLPFNSEVAGDMMGETHQRVKAVGERRGRKPNAFHILDSFRAAAMAERAETIEAELDGDEQEEVLDMVG